MADAPGPAARLAAERTATETTQPTRLRRASGFDFHRTVRDNLRHYDGRRAQAVVETPHFRSRVRRYLERWQVLLAVDQSGSMAGR